MKFLSGNKKPICIVLLLLLLLPVPLASFARTSGEVPAGMKELVSDKPLDFRVFVPEEWIQDKADGMVSAYAGYGDPSSFSVTTFALDRDKLGMTAEEYWESYQADFEATFGDFALDEGSPEAMLLNGAPAKKYIVTATVTGVECAFTQVVCVRGGAVYLLTFTSQPSLAERHKEDLENIFSHFLFN